MRALARCCQIDQEPKTRTNSRAVARRPHPSSAPRLEIKRDRGNGFDTVAVYRHRVCAPMLHRFYRGVGENRLTRQDLLYFDASIRLHFHLELHDSLNSRAPCKLRIGRAWRGEEPLEKIIGVLSQSAKYGYLELVHPTL